VSDSNFVPLVAYNDGLKGWVDSARDRVLWQESQPKPVYSEPNLAGSGQGKRALLYSYYMRLEKRAFKEVQTEPDCVSHGSRNARDTSRSTSILLGKMPIAFGGLSATEPTYGARGWAGGGMIPARASTFENQVGYVLRKKVGKYDLSQYNGAIGAGWGAGGVPAEVAAECNQTKVQVIRQITTVRDAIDCLHNGYAMHSGQYAKWSPSPNKQHYHSREPGGWNHDMATVGYDDTRTFWPFTVMFVAQSWGAWNKPPAEWPDDYPPPPPGLIVSKVDDWAVCVQDGDCWAYGGVDGFPPQKLPDFGSIGLLQHD
jgi:hypothetical protein